MSFAMRSDIDPDHLSTRHIQSIQLERRATDRARTYRIVLGLGSLGLSAQLIYFAVLNFKFDRVISSFIEIFISLILILLSIRLLSSAHHLQLRATESQLPEATQTPDFSTLSNGSQITDALARMTERREDSDQSEIE